VALQALESLERSAALTASHPHYREWATLADAHAQEANAERVMANVHLARASLSSGNPSEGHAYLRKATEVARELGDNVVFFAAASFSFSFLNSLRDREMVKQLADEILRRPREGVSSSHLAACLRSAGERLLARGERERADSALTNSLSFQNVPETRAFESVRKPRICTFCLLMDRLSEVHDQWRSTSEEAREAGVGLGAVALDTQALFHLDGSTAALETLPANGFGDRQAFGAGGGRGFRAWPHFLLQRVGSSPKLKDCGSHSPT